jgi:hypothetical protein
MKTRVTTLIALAAVVALPAMASAAPMGEAGGYSRAPAFPFPTVVIPRDDDATAIMANAEHDYLANACPTVLKYPGSYSSVLDRFCREFRG